MVLASLIAWRYLHKNIALKQIHIIHCNHNIRTQSKQEEKFIKTFFSACSVHVPPPRRKSANTDEKFLRERRYACFQKVLNQENINLLFLGHHLEDRIETTLLNSMR